MIDYPNEVELKELLQKIEFEYDLKNRLNRYRTFSSDLINFAEGEGLKNDEIVQALFVTDFIVTASEITSGTTDEERYKSVFQSFILGRSRNSSPDSLMRIFYFAYKTASKIRSQDLFMGGRGLDRKTSLIRLKDSYITPFLAISTSILGNSSCGWEIGVLSAALKRINPDIEIKRYINSPEFSDFKKLTKIIWDLLIEYSNVQAVNTNENIVISNLNSSRALLFPDIKALDTFFLWNHEFSFSSSTLKSEINRLTDLLEMSFEESNLALIKGRIVDTNEYLFIIREPNLESKPLLIIQTLADEINLSKALTILKLRGNEGDAWKNVFSDYSKSRSSQNNRNFRQETIATDQSLQINEKTSEKIGIFSKIKYMFLGRKKSSNKTDLSSLNASVQPKEIKKEIKRQKPTLFTEMGYIAKSIVVDSVCDLSTFELFDAIREDNYQIIGVFDSQIKMNQIKYAIESNNLIHNTLTSFLQNLSKTINEFYKKIFIDKEILFEELFSLTKDNQKFLISLNRNNEHLTGVIATSHPEKISDWPSRKIEIKPLQRRSVHMRTQQFLMARRHTHFMEAIERIFGEDIDIDNIKEFTINGSI